MKLDLAATLADGWAMFRRDRGLLLGLAGPFWLLPGLALLLLVPPAPPLPVGLDPASPAARVAMQAVLDWALAHGGWFLAAAALGGWGTVAVFVLYLDRDAPTVQDALVRAVRLWPRFILLNLLTALPVAAGLRLFLLPGVYVLARVLVAGPALVAEAPVGAWRSVRRSVALSRGAVLPLMGLAAMTLAAGWIAPQPLLMLDTWLRARPDGPNPVALVTVDALAASVAAAAGLAGALLAVAAYRRLARQGI